MTEITAVKPQKKRSGRFNVYLDGKFAFGVSAEELTLNKLKIGRQLTEAEVERLRAGLDFQKLLDKALKYLSYRPRSERELRDYLGKKVAARSNLAHPKGGIGCRSYKKVSSSGAGNSSDLVGSILGKLKDLGYVDDEEFARWWVEQRSQHRPRGKRLLERELFQKGIAKETIQRVLEDLIGSSGNGDSSEVALARKAAERRAHLMRGLPTLEFKKKLSSFLARRGFGWETIRQVVDSFLGER